MGIKFAHKFHMKKIDKLVFGSFIGPFLLTFIVIDFILLLVTLLKYFDEIMGKGLGFSVFAELIYYFSVTSSPDAFPLAILLSSIMTFGNLGEHSELTAVKSSGISLVRALVPIFFFVLLLTGFTFYSNTQLVPKTNLKTYSLLWDMRTKKPAIDIKEGVFYTGIPNYSIKVNEKIGDEQLKDIIIYDHTKSKRQGNSQGNRHVILADSGRMYSFMNQRFLALELFRGTKYEEIRTDNYKDRSTGGQFVRDKFSSSRMYFDLSSFDMNNTDENLFRTSRLVQTRAQLAQGVDSMQLNIHEKEESMFNLVRNTFTYHYVKDVPTPDEITIPKAYYNSLREARRQNKIKGLDTVSMAAEDSANQTREVNIRPVILIDDDKGTLDINEGALIEAGMDVKKENVVVTPISTFEENIESYFSYYEVSDSTNTKEITKVSNALSYGISRSRSASSLLNSRVTSLESVKREQRKYTVTRNQQMARSLACMLMFLIGAPIGAIIKKGGLGLPVIVSVVFFLIYYILNTIGAKWGVAGVVNPAVAVWISNATLLPFGLFFLRQARNDASLFETDFYVNALEKIKSFFKKRKE